MLDAQQSLDVAALAALGIRPAPVEALRRFDPSQKRDPNGEWGDGIPGPSLPDLDMEGFSLISQADGTFGELQMGVDDLGDVRLAWREDGHSRALDIGADELAELGDALDGLVVERDKFGVDGSADDLIDEHWFGTSQEHKAELLGNGLIVVTFGAEDPDPWTLTLDPPHEADPNNPDDEDYDDVQAVLDAIDDVLTEVDASRSARRGAEMRAAADHIFEDGICLSCADDEPDGPLDEQSQVLLAAISELGSAARSFNPAAHPRNPKGSAGGGRFRSNVDKLKDALKAHKAGNGSGDPFDGFDREQLRRVAKARGIELKRGEGRDSIAKKLLADLGGEQEAPTPKLEPKKRAPRKRAEPSSPKPAKKAAPKKAAPAASADGRAVGRDLIGSDGASLARKVVARRDSQLAADHSLAVIGHEQGFDGKPRVVPKAELDQLVKDGHAEIFRGVSGGPGGKTAAEIHEEMRSGHAWYGNGIYGNGYYWGYPKAADDYADGTPGSVARAVISPDAKIVDFWEELDERHTKFLAELDSHPDAAELLEVYGDIGRYAAALGYDAIRINQRGGAPPFYNVLNRSALVVEEAA